MGSSLRSYASNTITRKKHTQTPNHQEKKNKNTERRNIQKPKLNAREKSATSSVFYLQKVTEPHRNKRNRRYKHTQTHTKTLPNTQKRPNSTTRLVTLRPSCRPISNLVVSRTTAHYLSPHNTLYDRHSTFLEHTYHIKERTTTLRTGTWVIGLVNLRKWLKVWDVLEICRINQLKKMWFRCFILMNGGMQLPEYVYLHVIAWWQRGWTEACAQHSTAPILWVIQI